MIKQTVLGSLILTAMSITSASAATVEFRGGGFLTNPTPECIADGWGQSNYENVRFRPPNLGDNGPQTRLAIHSLFSAESYVLASGNLNANFKNVQGGGTFAATGLYGNQAKVRVTFKQPATITATTKDIIIAGQIQTIGDVAGCQMDFRFSLTLKP